MPASAKRRLRSITLARKNGSGSREMGTFAPGSLEADLAAIGESVPAREWANVPADFFAKLDLYLRREPAGRLPKK